MLRSMALFLEIANFVSLKSNKRLLKCLKIRLRQRKFSRISPTKATKRKLQLEIDCQSKGKKLVLQLIQKLNRCLNSPTLSGKRGGPKRQNLNRKKAGLFLMHRSLNNLTTDKV